MSYLFLIAAALGAGVINAVAGGGSFLTFPALVFTGVPSIVANATSTVAVFPGVLMSAWAYRKEMETLDIPVKPVIVASIAGGISGALLLLSTSQKAFDAVIPWLLLAATIVFAIGPRVTTMFKRKSWIGPKALVIFHYFAGIYGGYFGGAVGFIILAVWSLAGLRDIHAMNAGRTLLGGLMNAGAVVLFIIARKVWWTQAAVMLVAAVIGGYAGARIARRVNPSLIRTAIIMFGLFVTIAFFRR